MRQTLRTTLLFVAALIMSFTAFLNGMIAVPHLRADMEEINVRPTLLGAVSLGLHFGTFAMIGLACLVFATAIQSLRRAVIARVQLSIVAMTYIGFGLDAFAWSRSRHTLGFVLIGVLILGAVAIRERP